jgi:hypothetical protein
MTTPLNPQSSPLGDAFADLDSGLASTRKVLECFPSGKGDWHLHAKSRTIGQLAVHVAPSSTILFIIARSWAFIIDCSMFQFPGFMVRQPMNRSEVDVMIGNYLTNPSAARKTKSTPGPRPIRWRARRAPLETISRVEA